MNTHRGFYFGLSLLSIFVCAIAGLIFFGFAESAHAQTAAVTVVGSTISKNPLTAGSVQNTSVTIKSATNLSNLIVDIRIYNSSNTMIARKGFSGVNVAAGGTATLRYDYLSPASLPPGTYTMRVGVWNSTWAVTYLYETVKTFSVVSGIAAPTSLRTTSILATQVALAWNASTGASSYRVERCLGFGCTNFVQIAAPSGTTFSNIGLTGGTVYTYRVRAANSTGGFSAYTAPLSVLTPAVNSPTSVPIGTTPKITLVSSSVSSDPLTAGGIQTAKTVIGSATNLSNLIVDIRIYNSSNTMIARKGFDGINVTAGGTITLQYDYQSSATLPPGTYSVQVGVWSANYASTYTYETVKTFTVVSGAQAPLSAPTVPIGTTPKVTIVSSTLSADPLTAGGIQKATVTLGSATSLSNLIVNLMIYNSSGTLIGITGPGSVNMGAGTTATFTYDFASAANLPAGTYQFRVGVWGSTWSPTYLYEIPKTFSVVSGTTAPAPATESTQGSTITGAGMIVDANGAKWTIVGGIIYKDGVATVSANVTLLLYWNHTVYQQNSAGGWWSWVNGAWQGTSDPRVSTPTPAPAPAPAPSTITMSSVPDSYSFAGPYYVSNNMWGITGLTAGSYWQKAGIGPLTANNSVSAQWQWSFPDGPNEVKGYPSIGYGQHPGLNTTPGSNLPKLVNAITSAVSSWDVQSTNTGLGQLTYDLWLTRDAVKYVNFPTTPITHEIMLTVDSFGGYGESRNPAWYFGNTVIDGISYKVWKAECFGGAQCWRFIVLQMTPVHLQKGSVDFKHVFDYLKSVGLITGQEYLSSIEFGNEMQYGTGDVFVKDFKAAVW